MSFEEVVKRTLETAVRIIKLEREAIVEVADDEASLPNGLAIIAVGGLLCWIWTFPIGVVVGPVVHVATAFVSVALVYVAGMLLGARNWDFMRLFRALSYTYLLSWGGLMNVVPLLGQLLALVLCVYHLVVAVLVVETVGEVSRGKAVAIVLIPLLACCGIALVASVMFGAALFSLLGMEELARELQ